MGTQSNLSVEGCLQAVPAQVHLTQALSKLCPFVALALHVTGAHLQQGLVNKIYHPLLKVHFHHVFLQGKKEKGQKYKPISSVVLIRVVPVMLQGVAMGH